MASYTAGTPVACYTSEPFSDETGQPGDPTAVTFKWAWAPGPGQAANPTTTWTYAGDTLPSIGIVAKTALGTFEAWIDTTAMADGIVIYEFVGTGALQATKSGTFWVEAAAL